jgi:hypothetical protein
MDGAAVVELQVDTGNDIAVLELQIGIKKNIAKDKWEPDVLDNERSQGAFC